MSRTRKNKAQAGGGKVAALHRVGDSFVVLIGERTNDRIAVTTHTLNEAQWDEFAGTLAEQGVGRLVRVVPGGETVARCAVVPMSDISQMTMGAAMLAEAQLPESIPAHRRGVGVLLGLGEENAVPAVLVGWRGASGRGGAIEGVVETYCPIVGSLAALRTNAAQGAWFADPTDGSVSITSGSGKSASVRVVVEDNSSAVLWGEGVAALVGEQQADPEMRPRLGLADADVDAIRGRVSGPSIDARWMDDHGVALGALLLVLEGNAALAALAALTREAPRIKEPFPLMAASWLGQRSHAVWVGVAAAVLLLVAPMGFAWARVTILESKTKSLTKAKKDRVDLDRRAVVYAELGATRWPMTKLLSDISRVTPQGILVRDLRLQPEVGLASGGTEQGITLQGTAESTERVYDLQTNLNKSGLFRGVKPGRIDPKADGSVDFDMTMGVASAHGSLAAGEEWDWAKKPLAERLYGPGATNKSAPISKGGAASADSDRPIRRPNRTSAADEGDEKTTRRTTEKKESGGVPVALTDEQIAKFDRASSMKEMAGRRKYSQQNPSLDAATKRRLDDEVVKLRERLDVLNKAAGKAGA